MDCMAAFSAFHLEMADGSPATMAAALVMVLGNFFLK